MTRSVEQRFPLGSEWIVRCHGRGRVVGHGREAGRRYISIAMDSASVRYYEPMRCSPQMLAPLAPPSCLICGKPVAVARYHEHVGECLPDQNAQSSVNTSSK